MERPSAAALELLLGPLFTCQDPWDAEGTRSPLDFACGLSYSSYLSSPP